MLTTLTGGLATGCLGETQSPFDLPPILRARPGIPTQQGPAGTSQFELWNGSGMVYAPANVTNPAPLLLYLHGADAVVSPFLEAFAPAADAAGVILLAPYAASSGTWDGIYGAFGPDVSRINVALHWVFDRWQVDPARIVLTGFSDGGTYALAIGRANGDLFSRVVAYSPGFLIDVTTLGRPPILITHGTADTVLPIDRTSRVIVPELRREGYQVDYREWSGGHAVQLSVANEVIGALKSAGA